MFFSHGSNNARGVAILFRSGFDINIDAVKRDGQGRLLVIKGKLEDSAFTIVNIYAPNVDRCSRQFFENLQGHLLEFGISDEDNIIVGGDFNCPLNPRLDKQGGILVPRANVVSAIEGLQTTFNLHDIWRIKNPDVKSYTWSQKSPFVFCRLDFWLTSTHLFDHINSVDICPAIKTDHSAIIEFKVIEEQLKGPGSWKLNVSLLTNKDYVDEMGRVIPVSINHSNMLFDDKQMSWEWIKFKIREFSIKFSKTVAWNRKKEELELLKTYETLKVIHELCPSDDSFYNLEKIKAQLELIEEKKTEGIIVRARARWHEYGEKSNKYFLNLEKRNHIRKHIRKLNLSGVITSNPFEVLEGVKTFYKNLYTSKRVDLNGEDSRGFFENENIPKLSEEFKEICEGRVRIDEITEVLKSFKDNKVPGIDGLPAEFYKAFWHLLGETLVDSLNAAFDSGRLSISQRQAIITLIDKKDKDRTLLGNWRPISLLNMDVKLLSKALAYRIKKILPKIIHSNQSGYVEGRFIGETIRTIDDIMEFTKCEGIGGILAFLDFEKAFDSVEWNFLHKCLDVFNFGSDFKKWVSLLYTDISSCVSNNGVHSDFFALEREAFARVIHYRLISSLLQ